MHVILFLFCSGSSKDNLARFCFFLSFLLLLTKKRWAFDSFGGIIVFLVWDNGTLSLCTSRGLVIY